MGNKNQKYIGLFFIIIMFGSVVVYGINSALKQPDTQELPKGATVLDQIINRQLTNQEKVLALQSGRTIIEFYHTANCADCQAKRVAIENFAKKIGTTVIVSEVLGDRDAVEMIAGNGRVIPLEDVSENNLFDTFCKEALVKPKECLLRDFGTS